MGRGKYAVKGAEDRRLLEQWTARGRSSSVPLLVSYRGTATGGQGSGEDIGIFRRKSSAPMALPSSSPYLKFLAGENGWAKFLSRFQGKHQKRSDDPEPESSITKLRVMLFFCILDWVSDIGTSLYYWQTGRWVQATQTFGLVFGAGLGITIGFLKDRITRRWLSFEARAAGWYFVVPLYCPTLFPFFAGLMRLRYESAVLRSEPDTQLRNLLDEDLAKFRSLNLKANWCETVFEARPQLLLQLLLLLETTATFDNPLDILPVLLAIQSLGSVTNTIYTLVAAEAKDSTPIWSRIWGISYTGVSLGAPALITNLVRVNFDDEGFKFLATLLSLGLFFLIFELIYFTTYVVWRRKRGWGFGQSYYCVLPFIYAMCLVAWICLNEAGKNRRLLVSGLFGPALIIHCIAFYVARDFAELSFRLKNDQIEQNIQKFRKNRPSSSSEA